MRRYPSNDSLQDIGGGESKKAYISRVETTVQASKERLGAPSHESEPGIQDDSSADRTEHESTIPETDVDTFTHTEYANDAPAQHHVAKRLKRQETETASFVSDPNANPDPTQRNLSQGNQNASYVRHDVALLASESMNEGTGNGMSLQRNTDCSGEICNVDASTFETSVPLNDVADHPKCLPLTKTHASNTNVENSIRLVNTSSLADVATERSSKSSCTASNRTLSLQESSAQGQGTGDSRRESQAYSKPRSRSDQLSNVAVSTKEAQRAAKRLRRKERQQKKKERKERHREKKKRKRGGAVSKEVDHVPTEDDEIICLGVRQSPDPTLISQKDQEKVLQKPPSRHQGHNHCHLKPDNQNPHYKQPSKLPQPSTRRAPSKSVGSPLSAKMVPSQNKWPKKLVSLLFQVQLEKLKVQTKQKQLQKILDIRFY